MATWCESWNIKINEAKTWEIYFTHRNRPHDSLLTLNCWNILFVNSVKYLGVLFDKSMTEIAHTDDQSQGLKNIHSNIFPIQKCAIKR
jgi:hypothetical protein